MIKYLILLLSLVFTLSTATAQNSKLEKKLTKVEAKLADGKYEKAEKTLFKVLEDYPTSGAAWDLMCKTQMYLYDASKREASPFANMSITTTTKDGEPVKNDSLAQSLMEMLASISPSAKALSKAKYYMRVASIYSNTALWPSIYLRSLEIDADPDTNLNQNALNYYYKAEEQFGKRNYNKAAQYYQKAIDEEPQFYKASLYLGDAFYALKVYDEAIAKFKEAIEKFPNELEPRKYLVDAYLNTSYYKLAQEEALKTFAIYPDVSMTYKLYNALRMQDKSLNVVWTPRPILPNSKADEGFGAYRPDEPLQAFGPWIDYRAAFADVADYCTPEGLLLQNNITEEEYLELYSWRKMMAANPQSEFLEEARRMEENGFLDCYVFITCFHHDFYQQHQAFAKRNKDKIAAYFAFLSD